MKIIVFNAVGKFAHFRKIYTNSSSLSYYFPPPTTIAGIVAAMLGLERDSYYDTFGREQFKAGVSIVKPLRKITQTLNYIKAEGLKGLYQRDKATQIPFELITGEEDDAEYRFYIWHKDAAIMGELYKRVLSRRFEYPPYLGAAPFSCYITNGKIIDTEPIKSDEPIGINSIINIDHIKDSSIKILPGSTRLIKEIVPKGFKGNRIPEGTISAIFDEKCAPITAVIKSEIFMLENENVVML